MVSIYTSWRGVWELHQRLVTSMLIGQVTLKTFVSSVMNRIHSSDLDSRYASWKGLFWVILSIATDVIITCMHGSARHSFWRKVYRALLYQLATSLKYGLVTLENLSISKYGLATVIKFWQHQQRLELYLFRWSSKNIL